MRRDSNDIEWQRTKEAVFARDKNTCRLCNDLTIGEAHILMKHVKGKRFLLEQKDPAHHLPVSTHPELCYRVDNVFTLCRYMHDYIDNLRNPITGERISVEEREEWWQRIIQAEVK